MPPTAPATGTVTSANGPPNAPIPMPISVPAHAPTAAPAIPPPIEASLMFRSRTEIIPLRYGVGESSVHFGDLPRLLTGVQATQALNAAVSPHEAAYRAQVAHVAIAHLGRAT